MGWLTSLLFGKKPKEIIPDWADKEMWNQGFRQRIHHMSVEELIGLKKR